MSFSQQDIIQFTGPEYEAHRLHWQDVITRSDGGFQFPGSGDLAPEASDFATFRMELPAEAQARVKALGGDQAMETAILFWTGIFGLAARYSGSASITFDTLPFGQGDTALHPQALPICVQAEGGTSLKDLVLGTDAVVRKAFGFQALPLAAVFRDELPRTNVLCFHSPLQGSPDQEMWEQYDLVWETSVGDAGNFILDLHYRRTGFSADYVEALGLHWGNFLAGFSDMAQALETVDYLPESSRQQLLDKFASGGAAPARCTGSVLHHFAQHVAANPAAIALHDRERSWTYGELDEVANRLAHHLRSEIGVEKGDRIGILLDRSAHFMVGILGVWKAGAAYVPIDPTYPEARISYILENAAPRVVLTHSDYFMNLLEQEAALFAMDLQLDGLEVEEALPALELSGDELAYLIYTSGSTGQPKGVMVAHRSLEAMAVDQVDRLGIQAEDNILQFFSFAFDASLHRIGTALVSGARLTLVPVAVSQDPQLLGDLVARHEVTVASFPSAYLGSLDAATLASVRIMTAGAESVRLADARRFSREKDFYNVYGPTETTVLSTCHRADPDRNYARLPIGRPLQGEQAYVLDQNLRLMPVGVEGELCIGGIGLALGYWGDAPLTEAKFVPHPFREGEKLYRTGDRVRWTPEGELEFLGRKDKQVKIRGYRIELGEIEAAMRKEEAIRQVVVQVLETTGAKQLAAWYVADQALPEAALRRNLAQKLPAYMVPVHLMHLDTLPLTAHGKIKLEALPDPETRQESATSAPEVATALELQLLEIWQEVLGSTTMTVSDDFFAAGGDSIKAIRLVAQINKRYGIRLEVAKIFDFTSVRSLAPEIELLQQQPASENSLELPEESPGRVASEKYWTDYLAGAKVETLAGHNEIELEFEIDADLKNALHTKLGASLPHLLLAAIQQVLGPAVAGISFAATRLSRYEPAGEFELQEYPLIYGSASSHLETLIQVKDTIQFHRLQAATPPDFSTKIKLAVTEAEGTALVTLTGLQVEQEIFQSAVEQWIVQLEGELAELEVRKWTRSDFPLLDLSAADLATFPATTEDAYPLADIQFGMVYHSLKVPGSTLYRKQNVLTITEKDFDPQHFANALDLVTARHGVLRTSFVETENGNMVQLVRRFVQNDIQLEDLRPLAAAARDARIRAYIAEDRVGGINFASGLLHHTKIFQLPDDRHLLILSMHHAIEDGWSFGNFTVELMQAYHALAQGEKQNMVPLRASYKDYILAQRFLIDAGTSAAFWQEYLRDFEPMDIPADVRPRKEKSERESLTIDLDPDLSERLRAHGKRVGHSSFSMGMATYAWFLYCLTGKSEVSFGYVTHNRPVVEDGDKIFGCFLNTVPVRLRLDARGSMEDICVAVESSLREIKPHEGYSYSRILEGTERPDGRPLYDTFFGYTDIYATEELWADDASAPLEVESSPYADHQGQGTNTPLSLVLDHTGNQFTVMVQFDPNRYSEASARFFAEFYGRLLADIPASWEQKLSLLESMEETEKDNLLQHFSGVHQPDLAAEDIVRQIEKRASATPDAEALVFETHRICYAELNAKANQLAHYLRTEVDLQAGATVGLQLKRTPEMVISILGILKAGATYVPLAYDLPEARLREIYQQAGCELLVTDSNRMFALADLSAKLFAVDIQLEVLETSSENPDWTTSSATPAYILFTSGSTGTPKGVVVSRLSLSNYITWANAHYFNNSSTQGNFPLWTQLGFDLTVTSLFSSLSWGGTLHIFPDDMPPHEILAKCWAEDSGINAIKLTPAHIALVEELGLTSTGILTAIVGGEALHLSQTEALFRHAPQVRIFNEYGPTEATVGCIVQEIQRDTLEIFIGRPIAGCEAYVCNEQLEILPLGVPGELCLGGICLADGYLGLPDETDKRFVPHPFQVGARLYRTGDLVRFRETGVLEYLGRTDDQLKLRGYRVEPEEIRQVMLQVPEVGDAAIVLLEDQVLAAVLQPSRESLPNLSAQLQLISDSPTLADQQYQLPNGWRMFHLNTSETELIVHEIFETHCYLQHGIALPENAVVFDVGANIGMFTTYLGLHFPKATVYSFEPLAPVYACLEANAQLLPSKVHTFNIGLSNEETEVEFAYYPMNTVLSGRYGDLGEEKEAVRNYLQNHAPEAGLVEELLEERVQAERLTCRLRKISDIIAENGVERIDLLKIDVEKSELDVLEGMTEADWKKVRQIVIEVHDRGDILTRVEAMLDRHGFQTVKEQDAVLTGSDIYNLYAVRSPGASEIPAPVRIDEASEEELQQRVQEHCQTLLPTYMLPDRYQVMGRMPLTKNGKLDRKALARAFESQNESKNQAPETEMERTVAAIWKSVLGLETLSVTDNFFSLGGHSLKATQLAIRLQWDHGLDAKLNDVFEYPTVRSFAARLAENGASLQEIVPAPQAETYPLSAMQKQIWLRSEVDPELVAFHIPVAMELHGELNVEALKGAFHDLVSRHAVLRSQFLLSETGPTQAILPTFELDFAVEQVTADELAARQKALFFRPFDLGQAPLLRIRIFRTGTGQQVLAFVFHHIVMDGWSMQVLFRDLGHFYATRMGQETAELPKLPVQYHDYAVWLQDAFRGIKGAAHQKFWREYLAGPLPVLQLPLDFARPEVKTYRGNSLKFGLANSDLHGLWEFAEQQGFSRFTVFFSLLNTLLFRLSGQEDMVVGVVETGRDRAETRDLLGNFTNPLPIRNQAVGELAFSEFAQQVKQRLNAAYTHKAWSFDAIVELLDLPRDHSRSPIFDVACNWNDFADLEENTPANVWNGLEMKPVERAHSFTKYDLSFHGRVHPDGLEIQIEFNRDLFALPTVQLMGERFVSLIRAAGQAPETTLAALDMATQYDSTATGGHEPIIFNF